MLKKSLTLMHSSLHRIPKFFLTCEQASGKYPTQTQKSGSPEPCTPSPSGGTPVSSHQPLPPSQCAPHQDYRDARRKLGGAAAVNTETQQHSPSQKSSNTTVLSSYCCHCMQRLGTAHAWTVHHSGLVLQRLGLEPTILPSLRAPHAHLASILDSQACRHLPPAHAPPARLPWPHQSNLSILLDLLLRRRICKCPSALAPREAHNSAWC